MWKSLLAILSGILALTVTSFAIEAAMNPILLRTLGMPESAPLTRNSLVMAVTFTYGLVCVALGGYVCARLAPRLPLHHAVAMGVVQVGLTVVAMRSMPEVASRTQWTLSAILALPAAMSGGLCLTRQAKATVR
jgi:hypothetical protein